MGLHEIFVDRDRFYLNENKIFNNSKLIVDNSNASHSPPTNSKGWRHPPKLEGFVDEKCLSREIFRVSEGCLTVDNFSYKQCLKNLGCDNQV